MNNQERFTFNSQIIESLSNANHYLYLKNEVSNIQINDDYLAEKNVSKEIIDFAESEYKDGITLNLEQIVTLIRFLAQEKGLILCPENEAYHTDENKPCGFCENKYFIPLERYLELHHKWSIPPF